MTSSDRTKHIAIFASGSGSNAERIIRYFEDHPSIFISLIVTNNANAGIIEKANRFNIAVEKLDKTQYTNADSLIETMRRYKIGFIVLAGYLKLIPAKFTEEFKNRIVNIHPALLPKYGGKGMYGNHVHEAVVNNKETKSGLTIHFVSPEYDEGSYIFQANCSIEPTDSPKVVAQKVLRLEHMFFAPIIEQVCYLNCQ